MYCKDSQRYKSKVVPLHTIKACRGNGGMASLILNLYTLVRCGHLSRSHFNPGEAALWFPLNRGLRGPQSRSGRLVENTIALTRLRVPDRPARKLISLRKLMQDLTIDHVRFLRSIITCLHDDILSSAQTLHRLSVLCVHILHRLWRFLLVIEE